MQHGDPTFNLTGFICYKRQVVVKLQLRTLLFLIAHESKKKHRRPFQ